MARKAFSSSIEELFKALRAGESPSKLLRVPSGPSISPVRENLLATGPIEQQSPISLVHFIKCHAYGIHRGPGQSNAGRLNATIANANPQESDAPGWLLRVAKGYGLRRDSQLCFTSPRMKQNSAVFRREHRAGACTTTNIPGRLRQQKCPQSPRSTALAFDRTSRLRSGHPS
jgi:hypothetical protein